MRAPKLVAVIALAAAAVGCGSTPDPGPSSSPVIAAPPASTAATSTPTPTPGGEPSPGTSEASEDEGATSEGSIPSTGAGELDPLAPPARPVPTDDEVRDARSLCGRGWRAFLAGDLVPARASMDSAIAVLAFGTSDDARRGHGACLYNRGRWAEASGDVAQARRLYERSLEVRPDETVRARLAALPSLPAPSEAPSTATSAGEPPSVGVGEGDDDWTAEDEMTRPSQPDAAVLYQHADNPCRGDVHCAFTLSPMSIYGTDMRVGVVEVWQHESEVGADFPAWRGTQDAALTVRLAIELRDEPMRWGPVILRYDGDMSESITVAARIEFVDLHDEMTPLVRVITNLSVSEVCCGGRSITDVEEHAFCALHAAGEPSACAHALVSRTYEGSADDPSDDGYGTGSDRYAARAVVRGRQLTVSSTEGAPPAHVATPADDRFAAHDRVTSTFDLGSL